MIKVNYTTCKFFIYSYLAKISIGYDVKTLSQNNNVASQIYRKNNLTNNSLNLNNFNQNAKSNDLTKTPLSGHSQNSINNYNNNIIINNKYEVGNSKPITNLNMIFKFKTILNDDINPKPNKIIKIDAKKIVKNSSNNKNKHSNIQGEKTTCNSGTNLINNNSNLIVNNIANQDSIMKGSTINPNFHSITDKKEIISNYNTNGSTNRAKNDCDLNNKKITSLNYTLKSGNSTSKNNIKSTKLNEFQNLETIKYSINHLKEYLNPQKNNNARNNSKSKSKGKYTNTSKK